MTAPLLTLEAKLPEAIRQTAHRADKAKTGIVHLGLGAFHKAHQAYYTDLAMEAAGGDWKILGVSMRNRQIPSEFNAQNGLFTLITKSKKANTARVVSSIDRALCAQENPDDLLQAMSSRETRIVSLTVTEKGYCIDRKSGGLDFANPVIAHDLENPSRPHGVLGLIVEALRKRRESGIRPFTVLCCDNLPDNGPFVKAGVLGYAEKIDLGLASWIEDNTPFPSTMVDRITPAQTAETLSLAEQMTGYRDLLAIETEPFHQWVIEDNFSMGRPEWDKAGALFAKDVAPYEKMKLRMLNGAHSMLAYAGFLAGHTHVRDVMQDRHLAKLVARHMEAAAKTLPQVPGINLDEYAQALLARFANPEIAHETFQIAMDGSQKLPQRIFAPALDAWDKGQSLRPFALATAFWMHFCRGRQADIGNYNINDPAAEQLVSSANKGAASAILSGFNAIPGLVPEKLAAMDEWNSELAMLLDELDGKDVNSFIKDQSASIANKTL